VRRGQAAAEYVLLVALVLGLFCGAAGILRTALAGLLNTASGVIALPLP